MRRKNITIPLVEGNSVKVQAYVSPDAPGLAVHHPIINEGEQFVKPYHWVITHIQSGVGLSHASWSLPNLERVLKAMADSGIDWTKTLPELQALVMAPRVIRAAREERLVPRWAAG